MDHTDWIERYAWFGAFRTMPGGLSSVSLLIICVPARSRSNNIRPSDYMTKVDTLPNSDDSTSAILPITVAPLPMVGIHYFRTPYGI